MTSQVGRVGLYHQNTGASPYLSDRIKILLKSPGLKRLRVMVAYARWDGIGLLASSIEEMLKSGVELQTLYGIRNGVTTPDSLLYALYLQKLYKRHTFAGAVEDKFINATFHPKILEFRFADRLVAFVGSANLTGAGLSRNTEVNVEVECNLGGPFEAQVESAWQSMCVEAQRVDIALIRQLSLDRNVGSENLDNESQSSKAGKPAVKTVVKVTPKPLFEKVLDIADNNKKIRLLSSFDAATARPNVLYLQILEGETGAQSTGGIGYQIQLPTATLATFFGVGPTQKKEASFRFGKEVFTVHLTHFENSTHRVRLRPLRDVPRPGIVIFHRTSPNHYNCSIVPSKDYRKVLASKCTQQTRSGARRWGME